MLVVDAANVVGSRPDGWWRDRAKAAENLCRELIGAIDAGQLTAPVLVVLEGAARKGVGEHEGAGLRVVHAPHSGDDAIAALVADAVADGQDVTVVTADRELRDRTRRAGGDVLGPRWLLDRM
jgi:YacP-like NYN domain